MALWSGGQRSPILSRILRMRQDWDDGSMMLHSQGIALLAARYTR